MKDEKDMTGREKLEEAFRRYEESLDENNPPADLEVNFSPEYEAFIDSLRAKLDRKNRKRSFWKRAALCGSAM